MSTIKIKLKIVTPERTLFEQEVDQITLPVTDGEVTIMPDHRSYIASLKAGEVMFKMDGKETLLVVSSGFVEFNNNTLVVLADTAEAAGEIDLKRAEEARKRAEEIKNEKVTMSEMEYARVAAAIEKESARVRVARKHHSRGGIKID
ncbi:MAG: ATP synthase epsilon chain [Candidatus Moranbacteria bacterium GW2011_GWD2_36_12]|nr:MAG: ATP synthase epsilon chain [Candidatus Moranbacteria bacterium GW2011_GWD2_36_12]KKQ06869.1 MAG: ATP synthase epsilon chain [Candidatus Moranbacteria bacterium GW2011_GWE2_36_40]